MDNKRFLIIAGTNKSGTTSIFSYLSRHPEICPSVIKETMFFIGPRYDFGVNPIEDYFSLFKQCNDKKYLMESTPGYLDGGTRIATQIQHNLSDVRIIFILRNPVDRLISFYNSQKAKLNLSRDITIEKYISACEEMPDLMRGLQDNNHYWGIDGGYYAKYLREWYSVFPQDKIKVYFFDDLKNNLHQLIDDICVWLKIEPKVFANENFEIQNKTTLYGNAFAHSIAIRINAFFEPFLRRHPELKNNITKLYHSLNGRPIDETFDTATLAQIEALYRESNNELRILLRAHGYKILPTWLDG